MSADYYQVLGVTRDATDTEIKKAFHKKARELHPDVNKSLDAEDKFKELNEAYDVLSDTNKRAQYDRFGRVSGNGGGYSYYDIGDLFGGGFGMGDLFSTFFGGASASRAAVRQEGRDMGVGLRLTLEEVASGVKKELVYDRLTPCDSCKGTGVGEDGHLIECSYCDGSGRVVVMQHTFLGDMQTQTVCDVCGGTGKTIDNPCPDCEGQGRMPDRQHITVEVPRGIRDGQQLRLKGYGEAGMHAAAPGDLIVTVRVDQHKRLKREGDNLHTRVDISITQAALGATIYIDGILAAEKVEVKIPSGCQNDQMVRVRNKGLTAFKKESRGDLFVHVTVIVPRSLTKRQQELLELLALEFGDDIASKKTVTQRIKEVLS